MHATRWLVAAALVCTGVTTDCSDESSASHEPSSTSTDASSTTTSTSGSSVGSGASGTSGVGAGGGSGSSGSSASTTGGEAGSGTGSGGSGGASGGSGGGSSGGAGGGAGVGGSGSGGSGGSGAGGKGGGGAAGRGGSAGGGGSAGSGGSSGAGGSGGYGCIGGTCLNPSCTPLKAAASVDASPGTGFEPKPSYIPNDVIIPTLDDVPDSMASPPTQAKGAGNWTTQILAYLDANHMHWDFFINSNNACNLTSGTPPECTSALAAILKSHYPGNHTIHHWHLGMLGMGGCGDPACVQSELGGVESVISVASGGARPHLTRFRAPFGEPYQASGPGINFVPGAVAKFAVAIGWNLDSDDSNHDNGKNCTGACPTGQSIANTVQGIIKTPGTGSAYGVVLMHGIFGWTKDAIPLLFAPGTGYLARNGFRVGTVEDAICWKYGKHSWEIVQMLNGQARGPN